MQSKKEENSNYLISKETPIKQIQAFYENEQNTKTVFSTVFGPQTHSLRRKAILTSHPQVAALLSGTSNCSFYIALLVVSASLFVVYLAKDAHWAVSLLILYWINGTLSHTLHVLIHDFTHQSATNPTLNKVFAILCNVPMGVPSAIAFGKYHADHHNYLNQKGKDPDLPTEFEAKLSVQGGRLYRALHLFCCSLIYALRPLIVHSKAPTKWELINVVVILCTDYLIYICWGGWALGCILLSAFLSIGPHPAAMHIFAEHFETIQGLETYDYFGIMNFFNLNLGYHIEHHDFPNCPWYNLPKVRAAAKEYYEYLPHHTSYLQVMRKFIFDPKYNLYFRTIRKNK